MKILKIVMYSLCFVSLFWAVVVFFGAPFFTWAIVKYSDGQLIPSQVRVSPKLDIIVEKLDYEVKETKNMPAISGYSRAVKFIWSVRKGSPFLQLSFGPTALKDMGSADRISLYTSEIRDFELSKIHLNLKASNLDVEKTGTAKEVTMDGILRVDQSELTDLSLNAFELDLNYHGSYFMAALEGHLDRLSLVVPLSQQILATSLMADSIQLAEAGIDIMDVSGDVDFFNSGAKFSLNIETLKELNLQGDFKNIKTDGIVFTQDNRIESKFKTQVNSVSIFDERLGFRNVNAELIQDFSKNWSLNISAATLKSEIWFENMFYGTMPEASILIAASFDEKMGRLKSNVSFENNMEKGERIFGGGEISVALVTADQVFDCYSQKCDVKDITAKYFIDVGGERIDGTSKCRRKPCSLLTMRSRAVTSKTAEFFFGLRDQNLLNPLVLLFLQSAFLSGKQSGQGHEIEF